MVMKRILIIEDEKHIAEGLRLNLTLQGHEVDVAENGVLGIKKWQDWSPHLIILDLMMPQMDGFSVLENIRKVSDRLPVLILSAKDESKDKVRALSSGVDDYLTKPFELDELILRVDRLLKKVEWFDTRNNEELSEFKFGVNTACLVSGLCKTQNGEVQLTQQELKLLKFFISNEGKNVSRKEILSECWEYNVGEEVNTRTIDNFVARFRKYFDSPDKQFFLSIRSVGYKFEV